MIRIRVKKVSKNYFFWGNSQLEAGRWCFCELIVIFRMRSLEVTTTSCDRKSGDHWISSLATEQTVLLLCRLKLYKMVLEKKLEVFVSTNRSSTQLWHTRIDFCPFCFRFRWGWLWLAEILLQLGEWFLGFVVTSRLSGRTMCTICTD